MLNVLVAPRQPELNAAHVEFIALNGHEPKAGIAKARMNARQSRKVPDRLQAGQLRRGLGNRVVNAGLPRQSPFAIRQGGKK